MSVGTHQPPAGAQACGPRALCGWSPPSRAADTALKRRVDRIRVGISSRVGALAVLS